MNTPEWQRAMQRAHAQASMGGQPLRTAGIQEGLANKDIQRKLDFQRLGLQKKRADLQHRGRMAQYKMDKKELKDRKKMLPWTIALGGGTALMSALEGRSRANRIQRAEEARQSRWKNADIARFKNERDWRQRYLPNTIGERRGL